MKRPKYTHQQYNDIIDMWRFGHNTHEISVEVELPEEEVSKIIQRERERRKRLPPGQLTYETNPVSDLHKR